MRGKGFLRRKIVKKCLAKKFRKSQNSGNMSRWLDLVCQRYYKILILIQNTKHKYKI